MLSPRDYSEYEGESGEVAGRQPVVSAGDPSPVPEFAEHAFDDVAPTVGFTIQRIGVRRLAVEGVTALICRLRNQLRRLSASQALPASSRRGDIRQQE